MTFTGNFWTLYGHVSRAGARAPKSSELVVEIDDDLRGRVRLSGLLSVPERASTLVVIVHGLGGDARSGYVRAAARVAHELGAASLRVSMRGADGSGEDFYHAGLGSDIERFLQDPACSAFDRVFVLGYSLGGHIALSYAISHPDRRLCAVATVCAPLNLALGQARVDGAAPSIYRWYMLESLKRLYRQVARKRSCHMPARLADRIQTIYEWDDKIVAPRHRFESAPSYYRQVSVVDKLERLKVPALLVIGLQDPVLDEAACLPRRSAENIQVHRSPGGHLGFPFGFDLAQSGAKRLELQVLSWLLGHRAGTIPG